jgi:hypothetical protein
MGSGPGSGWQSTVAIGTVTLNEALVEGEDSDASVIEP